MGNNLEKKSGRPKANEQIIDKAIDKYVSSDVPARQIAEEYKIGLSTFKKYWRLYVAEQTRARAKTESEEQDVRQEAYEYLKNNKVSQREVAKKFNISKTSFNRYVNLMEEKENENENE